MVDKTGFMSNYFVCIGLAMIVIAALMYAIYALVESSNRKKKKSQAPYPSTPSDFRHTSRSNKRHHTDDLTSAALVSEAFEGLDDIPTPVEDVPKRVPDFVSAPINTAGTSSDVVSSNSASDSGSSSSGGGDSGGGD